MLISLLLLSHIPPRVEVSVSRIPQCLYRRYLAKITLLALSFGDAIVDVDLWCVLNHVETLESETYIWRYCKQVTLVVMQRC